MFATPLSTHLSATFAGQLLGRFTSPSALVPSRGSSAMVSAAQNPVAEEDDDSVPDLAQRVREVGEW